MIIVSFISSVLEVTLYHSNTRNRVGKPQIKHTSGEDILVCLVHVAYYPPCEIVIDMPAPVALSPTAHTSNKATGSKPRAPPRSKKTRIVRRRGRAKNGLESDDEIEREVGTDSETDDDQSSVDSASDSDTEPASEDVLPNGHARVLTPGLTQSSPGMVSVTHSHLKPKVSLNGDQGSFFGGAPGNWSEMVTDENVNGPADLPVIDFADFDGRSHQRHPRKTHKGVKDLSITRKVLAPVAVSSSPASLRVKEEDEPSDNGEPIASTSRQQTPRRAGSQTARQVYQQRLDKDPSYVPTVGEFWGHDDRLLDKDLRSLSGWWRGRWQGRGRGRGGFDRGFARGRGRGGSMGPQPPFRPPAQEAQVDSGDSEAVNTAPPIEKAWTHDGFEEMKRREDNHRPVQQQPPPTQPVSGFRGGRGAFLPGPRGRGGIVRGRFTPSPRHSNVALPFAPPVGRTWFAMKPERVWTKQHDGFLYVDPALKPRPGLGQGINVKLPGTTGQVVRISPGSLDISKLSAPKASTSSIAGSDEGERSYPVRIPNRLGKEKQQEQPSAMESLTTVGEPPVDDAFMVRPRPVTRPPLPDSQTAATVHIPQPMSHPGPSQIAESSTSSHDGGTPQSDPAAPQAAHADDQGWIQPIPDSMQPSEQCADHQENPPMVDGHLAPSVLPPLQTSFTPVPQVSPRYGSPYGYPPALPPGVAMNQQGVPYELSTGRAIYYQGPQQVYNPRPVMHTHMAPPSIPFVPGHMRHLATASPDFIAPPHTPPANGFIDPSTGTPMFSMPRQSSRIEIRAPTEQPVSPKTVRRPSGLRTTATAFEPQRSASSDQDQSYIQNIMTHQTEGSYTSLNGADGGVLGADATQQQTMDPAIMGYPSYQQQYYYPTDHYNYSQYVDMSQVGQYEMYPPDPHAATGPAIYY